MLTEKYGVDTPLLMEFYVKIDPCLWIFLRKIVRKPPFFFENRLIFPAFQKNWPFATEIYSKYALLYGKYTLACGAQSKKNDPYIYVFIFRQSWRAYIYINDTFNTIWESIHSIHLQIRLNGHYIIDNRVAMFFTIIFIISLPLNLRICDIWIYISGRQTWQYVCIYYSTQVQRFPHNML